MAGVIGKIWKKAAALVLALSLMLPVCLVPVSASPRAIEPPEIESDAAVVFETQTGRILYEKDGFSPYYPASTTKIVTALLAIERIPEDAIIEFTDYAISCIADEARHFELQPGEAMPLYSCLQALLIPSCNEAATAIAEYIAGSEEEFAKLMTARARQAGALNSNFIYPHGLQDSMHYVTAYDMSQILADCVKHPLYREISGSWRCTITDARESTYEYDTHNALLRPDSDMNRDWVVCSKTGHTAFAGYALMSFGIQDGMEVTCAVLGGYSYESVVADTVALCEYAFAAYDVYDSTAVAENLIENAIGACDVTLSGEHALLSPDMPKGPVLCDLVSVNYLGDGVFGGELLLSLPDGTTQTTYYEAAVQDGGRT